MTALSLPLLESERGFRLTAIGPFCVFPHYRIIVCVSSNFDLRLNSSFDPSVSDSSLYPEYLAHSRHIINVSCHIFFLGFNFLSYIVGFLMYSSLSFQNTLISFFLILFLPLTVCVCVCMNSLLITPTVWDGRWGKGSMGKEGERCRTGRRDEPTQGCLLFFSQHCNADPSQNYKARGEK